MGKAKEQKLSCTILELSDKQPRYRGQISPYAISNLVGSKTTEGFANVCQQLGDLGHCTGFINQIVQTRTYFSLLKRPADITENLLNC